MNKTLLLGRLLNLTYIPQLLRQINQHRKSVILLFHGTYSKQRSAGVDGKLVAGMDDVTFGEILKWLRQHNVPLITLDELVNNKRHGVHITFDDGYTNNHDYALPLLEKYEVPATFFISTIHLRADKSQPSHWIPYIQDKFKNHADLLPADRETFFENYWNGLTYTELATMAAHPLVDIGGHTVSHPFLSKLDEGAQRQELTASKQKIEEIIGKPINTFAYPYGDYNDTTIQLCKEIYDFSFAVNPTGVDYKHQIPRIGLYSANPYYLSSKLSYLYRTIKAIK